MERDEFPGRQYASLKVDGQSVSKLYGPYVATSGVNFSGAFGTLAPGSHSYVITAVDPAGHSTVYNGTFTVAGNPGPTIGSVYIPAAGTGTMSWSATDSAGLSSATLKVDGVTVKINGPYATATGANFSATLGASAAGSHSYVITATDKSGLTSTLSGTFTVAGSAAPVIGSVYIPPAGTGTMSWSATDSAGLSSATLKVDGVTVKVNGPYATATGANFSATFGASAAGNHSYVITATDKAGKSSTYNGTFTVAGDTPAPSSAACISPRRGRER